MTPAQAYGHPNFVTDVPVQGPTDEGLRAADCLHVQQRALAHPGCSGCKGTLAMQHAQGVLGEQISFGGARALGFALGGPGDPDIWALLSLAQQTWVTTSLNTLNAKIIANGNAPCPTWGPAINLEAGCFQAWYNNNYGPSAQQMVSPSKTLRTDGAFDEDTLCALIMIAGMHPADFPTPFPDPTKQYCQVQPAPTVAAASMMTPMTKKVLIGSALVAGIGGIVFAASKGGKGRRRRRR